MKIKSSQNENLYINMANKNPKEDNKTSSVGKSQKSSKVIYAGEINADSDSIGMKKQLAQKHAMKAIMDQYKKDKKSDDKVTTLLEKKEELYSDASLASDQIKNIRSAREVLKESYGITEDSTEQKNLDLLEKSIYGTEALTADEQKQLGTMGSLTDYQKSALKYDAEEKIWKIRVENAKNGIAGITESITSIGLARLKEHPMVDAQKQAIEIIEAASKEVIGTILQQTKESEDAKLDKIEEDAKKQQEAKKEEEAKKEKAAEKDQAAQNNQAASSTSSSDNLPASDIQIDQQQLLGDIKDFAKKQKMLEDDIKGIVVDEQA